MSSEQGVRPGARVNHRARSSCEASPFVSPSLRGIERYDPLVSPSLRGIERYDPPAMLGANRARSIVRRVSTSRGHVRFGAARLVLTVRTKFTPTPRALIVAARIDATPLATASFVENFSLAHNRARDGINDGTVRNESTPRMRAESIPPITQSTSRQESSSRVTPSRLTVLSPLFPRARPSRSDRTSVGCKSREDQGGPQ